MSKESNHKKESRRIDEIFETFSGSSVIAFVGEWGSDGLLFYRPASGWQFHPSGSTVWDGLHQEIYRNFRGDPLTLDDLKKRSIPPPPFDQYRNWPGIKWEENFRREVPFDEVPEGLLERLRSSPTDKFPLYLVLFEDLYETCFGDGRYRYPQAVFLEKGRAEEEIRRLEQEEVDPAKREWYRYFPKEISIGVDELQKKVVADLGLQAYEHYSLDDLLRLLAAG